MFLSFLCLLINWKSYENSYSSDKGRRIKFLDYLNWATNLIYTECVTDWDERSEMIILGLFLTTFESSSIFGGIWGSIENWLKPKIEPPYGNLACTNLRSVPWCQNVFYLMIVSNLLTFTCLYKNYKPRIKSFSNVVFLLVFHSFISTSIV